MSVVGFDLGNSSCIVAAARRRGIDVLQNEVGNRKTASLVGFSDKQRSLGDEATSTFMGNYKNTIKAAKRLLGRKMNDPSFDEEAKHVPTKFVAVENNEYVKSLRSHTGSRRHLFSPPLPRVQDWRGGDVRWEEGKVQPHSDCGGHLPEVEECGRGWCVSLTRAMAWFPFLRPLSQLSAIYLCAAVSQAWKRRVWQTA